MRRVLDHIDRHLDEDLDLAALSGVAAFSKHHFHRQFSATFGVSAHRYVQLARMKRASYRLAFRDDAKVIEIALDAGYEAPDAFARAFRDCVGQAPSAFRKSPDWEPWLAALEPLDRARSANMSYSPNDVTVREFPATQVAILTHRGDPARVYETVRRFIEWRRAAGLGRDIAATYTIFPCDPRTTPPDAFRLDLCAGDRSPDRNQCAGRRRRRDSGRTLRGFARHRLQRKSGAAGAVPLSRLAAVERRGGPRFSAILSADQLLSRCPRA